MPKTDAEFMMELTNLQRERQRVARKIAKLAILATEQSDMEFGDNLFRRALSRFVAGEKI